jgi:hypothetical protein
MSDLEPIDPELDRLLDVERARPSVPPATRDRLLGRVEASVATAAVIGAAGAAVTKKSWLLALSAFVLGGIIGAAAMWMRPAPEPRTVTVEKRVEVPVPVTVVVSAPTAPPPAPTVATSLAAPSTSVAHKPVSDAAERALIEKIHSALGRGDPAGALVAVGEHEKQFPGGSHADEREALAVQALSRQGRMDEARARADRFRKRFPGSFFSSIVDGAVGAKP